MSAFDDRFTLAEFMRDPELRKDLNFLRALRRMRVYTDQGDRPIRSSPTSKETALDLRGLSPTGEDLVGGDFFGPDGSGIDNIVIFADATGKRGKDSGVNIHDLLDEVLLSGIGGTEYDVAGDHVHVWTASGTFVVTSPGPGEILVQAGGGGGASGGGGAGGFVRKTHTFQVGTYAVVVGIGGATSVTLLGPASNGGDSSIDNEIAIGGGAAGGFGTGQSDGRAGGSGGGGGANSVGQAAGGLGTPGQGNDGAATVNNFDWYGGGGGKGTPGERGLNGGHGGNGGDGVTDDITGTPTVYAAGGGAMGQPGGAGGSSNTGGHGGTYLTTPTGTTAPAPNSGSGGGSGTHSAFGSAGADGKVVVRYPKTRDSEDGILVSRNNPGAVLTSRNTGNVIVNRA